MVLKTPKGWRAAHPETGASVGPHFRRRRFAVAFRLGITNGVNRYQDDREAAEAYHLGQLLRK